MVRCIFVGMIELPAPLPPEGQTPGPPEENERWRFLRDVAVFELKLALNNLHNFVQIPLTIGMAVFDLIFKGRAEGERFYHFVELGRTIDDSIDIYSIIDHRQRSLNAKYTVDAVLKRVEDVVVREYAKGGTAASVKSAVDRVIDEMQAHGAPVGAKTDEAIRKAAENLRKKMQRPAA
jgi:hypothetical protein